MKVQQISFNATTLQALLFLYNGERQIKIPIDIQYIKSVCNMKKPKIEVAKNDEGEEVIYYLFDEK